MFVAYVEGSGEGCDYTIGCNLAVKVLPEHIETMEQAIEYCTTLSYEGEDAFLDYAVEMVSSITVFEVADSQKVDIAAIKAAKRAEKRRIEEQRKEEQERAELARLKAQYEK